MPSGRPVRVLVLDADESSRLAIGRSIKASGLAVEVLDARSQEVYAREEFLATLSHELRTPLNAILGWARLIISGTLDAAAVMRAVSIIERNAGAEARLIDDLLDMSRLESGSLKLDVHPTRLASLLEAAVDAIRPASRAKEIALEIDSSGALQEIACDEQRVRQILWNLLSNAVKFTPRGGRISVMAITGDRKLLVTVADTGAGITPEFLPYVFDCFRQQDTATTRSHGGLGIGLAIARHLAELHGGKVQAASDGVGHGSTFTLTLPLGPIRQIATS